MTIQKIRSNNGSREGKWVLLSIVGILSISALSLPYNQVDNPQVEMLRHQVLITDLEQEELALIAELKLAHEEIRDIRLEAGEWPNVKDLEANWIAPFVKDQSWSRKGAHQWLRIENGLYLGMRRNEKGAASMLLDCRKEQAEIWFSKDSPVDHITMLIEPQKRQQLGWLHVVLSPPSQHSLAH